MNGDFVAELKRQLMRHEGFRQYPYRDTVGVLTIGYGRNLEAKGISEAEAEYLLENDIFETMSLLSKRVPVFQSLDPVRRNVVVNMAFNLGVKGLMGFKKMLVALEANQWSEAAAEMLQSKWASQVGKRAEELAQQMRDGQFDQGN